ncbi:MAG: LysM peptidoglycan-binding domain-containing protein [Patescibacteria group bacterium]
MPRKMPRREARIRFSLFCLVLLAMFALAAKVAVANWPVTVVSYTDYTVKQGDTIWSIAKEYNPKGAYVCKVVHEIRDAREEKVSNLFPGQHLRVPVYKRVTRQ